MAMIHLVVLAIVQGVTEFLPISSSAHLILVPIVFGWPDQGLLVDVAVHVGTLGAVMVYFWRDVVAMAAGMFDLVRGRLTAHGVLLGLVIIGTLPIVVAGFLMDGRLMESFRDIRVIGWTTLGFGILLYVADRFAGTRRTMSDLRSRDAVLIGLAQVLALIPGTSRSGITMTAARMLGIDRAAAARFALLLSMPAILGAGVLQGADLYTAGDTELTGAVITAMVLAFGAALAAIAAMMAWLRRATFTPFVVYRVVLGVILLAIGYDLLG
ncbi:MAG: undecaprenyl-diphosphate phosphatase [Rhodospirillales bacterium]|nr:MAG: undecaprenyl-diphosphate phosphatase [Rhodospirillales bacterium]